MSIDTLTGRAKQIEVAQTFRKKISNHISTARSATVSVVVWIRYIGALCCNEKRSDKLLSQVTIPRFLAGIIHQETGALGDRIEQFNVAENKNNVTIRRIHNNDSLSYVIDWSNVG